MTETATIAVSIALLWGVSLVNLLISLGIARRLRAMGFPRFESLRIGIRAPEFAAVGLDGRPVTIDDFAGATALIFISPDCEPCLEQLPAVVRIRQLAEGFGVQVVLVSDADASRTEAIVEKFHLDGAIVVAPVGSNPLFSDYRVSSTPSFCLIDVGGRVAAVGREIEGLEPSIRRLVEGS